MSMSILRHTRHAFAAVVVLAILLWPDAVFAQPVVGGALDNSVDAMQATLARGGGALAVLARRILLFLLVIEFVWRGGKWLFSGQSVGEFLEPMVFSIGLVTLAWGFTSAVPEVVEWIAAGAVDIASQAAPGATITPADLRPSGIMAKGLERAFGWIEEISLWEPSSLLYVGCAIVSVVVLAGVLAVMIIIYAEIFLVALVGIVTLGFAGLSQTRGIAAKYVMSLFGKGFKLMTLLLLVDATERLAQAATGTAASMEGALSAILLQIIGAVMIMLLPGAVERLVAGSGVGDTAGSGGKMVTGAAAAVAAPAAGALAGANMGAVAGAVKGVNEARGQGTKAMLKAAGTGALKGGWNWGGTGRQGKITSELGDRLGRRVNRVGSGGRQGDAEGGP